MTTAFHSLSSERTIYCSTGTLNEKNCHLEVGLHNIAIIYRGQNRYNISHSPHLLGFLFCPPPHGTRLVPPLPGRSCYIISPQLHFVQTTIKPLPPPPGKLGHSMSSRGTSSVHLPHQPVLLLQNSCTPVEIKYSMLVICQNSDLVS